MYHNIINGKLKKISLDELLELFDAEVHGQIHALHENENMEGLVVFENLQMDSSEFGSRSVLIVGEGFSTPDVETASKHRLGDVPSRFLYPTRYLERTS